MGDKWIPEDILAFSPKISNFTENPTTVQFDHRILGTTTLALISGLWLMSRKRVLPSRAYTAVNVVAILGWLQVKTICYILKTISLLCYYFQVALGITTLLTYVPTSIAASHQSGSLFLLSAAVWLTHELKKLPK